MGYASDLADILSAVQAEKEKTKNGGKSTMQELLDQHFAEQRGTPEWQRAQDAINRGTNALNAGTGGSGSTGSVDLVSFLKDYMSGSESSSDVSGSSGSSGSGSGFGSFSGSSGMSGYDSYLDMLHQEQERVWNREDTYYQRAVKDMQAAGLNPVLAVSHGVSGGGSSASSDSQVVGAVADLAAMAISGLTETAKGIGALSAVSGSPSRLQQLGSWYSKNAKTINTAVNTASTVGKIIAMLA